MSGRVGALAPARHARRVHLPEAFFPPRERGLFSTVRSKTLKKKTVVASELTLGATAYEGGGGAGVRSRSPRGGPWLGGLALSKANIINKGN